jgi:hypothetical protein
MAVLTKQAASFDNESCVWEYDYEDGSTGGVQRLIQIRCTNNSALGNNTRGTVTVMANGRSFTMLVVPTGTPAGQVPQGASLGTFSQNLPGNAQSRLGISIDERGRVDGLDHHFEWGPHVV